MFLKNMEQFYSLIMKSRTTPSEWKDCFVLARPSVNIICLYSNTFSSKCGHTSSDGASLTFKIKYRSNKSVFYNQSALLVTVSPCFKTSGIRLFIYGLRKHSGNILIITYSKILNEDVCLLDCNTV